MKEPSVEDAIRWAEDKMTALQDMPSAQREMIEWDVKCMEVLVQFAEEHKED